MRRSALWPRFPDFHDLDLTLFHHVARCRIGVREIALKTLMEDLAGMRNEVAVLGSLVGFACSLVWALLGGILFLRPADRTPMKQIEEATHAGS